MGKRVVESAPGSAEAYTKAASLEVRKNLGGLEAVENEIKGLLSNVEMEK